VQVEAIRRWCTTCREANDQTVFDRFCTLPSNSLIMAIALAAIAFSNGASLKPKVANAHAVFDMFCGLNEAILRRAAAEIASSSGAFIMLTVANDHERFDMS